MIHPFLSFFIFVVEYMFKQYKKSIKYFNTPLRLLLVCSLFSSHTLVREYIWFSFLYEQPLLSWLVLLFCVCGTPCGDVHSRQTFDNLDHSQNVQLLPLMLESSHGCVLLPVC
jgi:hypothetical protein